ncbi:MAG: hypothetical protein JSS07_03265 [Proteobacteria bacterium]|nr:hypothetical protein [Pseudomonadota bacterium]
MENTTNLGGGVAWDIMTIKSICAKAKELDLKMHLCND